MGVDLVSRLPCSNSVAPDLHNRLRLTSRQASSVQLPLTSRWAPFGQAGLVTVHIIGQHARRFLGPVAFKHPPHVIRRQTQGISPQLQRSIRPKLSFRIIKHHPHVLTISIDLWEALYYNHLTIFSLGSFVLSLIVCVT